MSEDENEKEEKIRYAIPLGGDPPLYMDSEASDEGTIKHASRLREQSSLMRGVILGLMLGIIGNVFVSHYYAMFSVLITDTFGQEALNLANVLATFIYLAGIMVFSWFMYNAITGLEDTSSRLETYVRMKKEILNSIKEWKDNGKSGDAQNEG